jgi:muramoyltetrapeptide carboxypeptidase
LLSRGARVAVVAPAHPFDPERLRGGLDWLRDWGATPVEAPNLRARHRYTAGTVAERAADLQWALSHPDLDAVWFARGGSGTGRLLDALDWSRVVAQRPVFGFSDATALFCGLWRRGRGRPVHAPVLHSILGPGDAESRDHLAATLAGRSAPLPARQLCGPVGPVEAPLLGGNLCVLASLCGTPWQLDARGALLLLEDIGEPPYKLDRLIWQLDRAGALDGLAGVALGEFTGCGPRDPDAGWDLDALFTDLLGGRGVPVFTDLPVGHGARNHAFVWGRRVRLEEAPDACG